MHLKLIAALVLSSAITGPLAAQQRQAVHFKAGNDNAAVEASVVGDGYRDYVLGAKAGQNMGVSLITDGSAYFNILPPGSTGEAIYNSSFDGNDATGVKLPASGDYTIRVYLMGANFTLSMSIM